MLNLNSVHPSFLPLLQKALAAMNPDYLEALSHDTHWLPGKEKIFNAFSLPLPRLKRILFGESPYPRKNSANGYAFWDSAVDKLWSEKGLSREVNRATSLRNFIKMLLLAEKKTIDCDKSAFIQTLRELFQHLLQQGFLLLNATLVYRENKVREEAKTWQPFIKILLEEIYKHQPQTELIFLGQIAKQLDPLIQDPYKRIYAEHPYNLSFITNPVVLNYFKPFKLLYP